MSSALSKCIVQPSRLASIVDWKRGTLLALDIQSNSIQMALAKPCHGDSSIHRLESIPYSLNSTSASGPSTTTRTSLPESSYKEQRQKWRIEQKRAIYESIVDVTKTHQVTGFVCAWPLETSGQPGKSCGQIFHLLDYLVEQNDGLLTQSRPLTLWDERKWTHQTYDEQHMPHDDWGRSSIFSRETPLHILQMKPCPTVRHPTDTTAAQSSRINERSSTDEDDMAYLVLKNFVSSYFEEKDKYLRSSRSAHYHRAKAKEMNQNLLESLVQYERYGGSTNLESSLAPM